LTIKKNSHNVKNKYKNGIMIVAHYYQKNKKVTKTKTNIFSKKKKKRNQTLPKSKKK
jgi:hypothetical protein